ncbi:MAG TPA: sigma-54 dependent transcriptional regulator [Chitinivibrionales bacterium]|nr:sigma-54 dependent transcriptional regulator [Chitinivibrionales bacterium]
MAKILIVDDEAGQRNIMASILTSEGHTLLEAPNVDQAIGLIRDFQPQVVLTDLKMPGKSGLVLVEEIAKLEVRPEIVVITAFGTVETAVKAMQSGAYTYLNKPLGRDELILVVRRAAEKYLLREESDQFRAELTKQLYTGLVAESAVMKNVLSIVAKVAQSDSTVLIRGESGTGKERIAKLIHYQGPRSRKLMQSINCAAFTETLLESELFGHEKGSFTGAQNTHIGIVESASGSTLFLDEVGDMSLSTQAKLLRVLQERQIRRVGGTKAIPVDIRVIAATNKNLEEAIKQGTFRDDLYYRLNIIPIVIPPLRERKEDIEALVAYFISRSGRPKTVEEPAMKFIKEYQWPGNVRELEAVMERITVLSTSNVIKVEDLPQELCAAPSSASAPAASAIPEEGIVFEEWEKNMLAEALKRSNGVMADAAKLLGMSYRTFQYRAEKFGLKEG